MRTLFGSIRAAGARTLRGAAAGVSRLLNRRGHLPLVDIARAADASYSLRVPRGFRLIKKTRAKPDSGFRGIALVHEASGKLVVSFTGTITSHKLDLVADGALVMLSTDEFRRRYRELDAKVRRTGKITAAPNTNDYGFEVLSKRLVHGRRFFDSARKKAAVAKKDAILTGHSLGGFLAQVVAYNRGAEAHVFNSAPHSRRALANPNATSRKIKVHCHPLDIACLGGNHIGRKCTMGSGGTHAIRAVVETLRKVKTSSCY